MKQGKRILTAGFCILLLLAAGLYYHNASPPISENENEGAQELLAPYDYFEMARNYPNFQTDVRAYQRAVQQAQQDMRSFSKRNTAAFAKNWIQEGPTNIGGRVVCVAVHPQNTDTYFLGAVYGGIYKTTDGGLNWKPVFDSSAYLSVGCITIDASNPNTMYAGTGDPALASSSFTGNGIYKSVDGGETWTYSGLAQTGVVTRIAIDPSNSQVLYASTMGFPMRRDQNRGLYKSTDGGQNWTRILGLGNESGTRDVRINPNNPSIIYTTGMRRFRSNTENIFMGTQTRIYRSQNGGTTWDTLAGGLPTGPAARVNIELLPSNPNTLFASVVDTTFQLKGIYKSTNGGNTWSALNIGDIDTNALGTFGWYFGEVRVNPFNESEIFLQGVDLWRSTNNGQNWDLGAPPWSSYEVHADKHDIAFISNNTRLLATDGGLYKTTNAGQIWDYISNIPITQFYHVKANPWIIEKFYGGAQDNGTSSGNAHDMGNWTREFGGDGFRTWFSPRDPSLTYMETQNGNIVLSNGLSAFQATDGIPDGDRKNWDLPYFISRHAGKVYAGTQYVYRADDETQPLFSAISPDLTDGNIYGERFHNISALCESMVEQDYLYAGTSDGNVWRSLNGGSNWTNITTALPDRYVTWLATSYHNKDVVYVSHSGYKYDDYLPHIQKSTDNGSTWTDISGNLPQFAINSILTFAHDSNLLMVATDGGVYASNTGGNNWERVGGNMPIFPVYDLDYDPATGKVIAGTFARSVMSYQLLDIHANVNQARARHYLNMYPSPAASQLTVETGAAGILDVYNIKGEKQFSSQSVSGKNLLNVQQLAPGVYLLRLRCGNAEVVKKFVKL